MATATQSSESGLVDASQKPAGQKEHIAFLDGMRAAAAIYVVLHHAVYQYCYAAFYNANMAWAGYGRYAVDVFIVLSGACLMIPVIRNDGVLKNGAIDFLRRRAWRILPSYYFAIALSLLLIHFVIGRFTGTHWDVALPVRWTDVVIHALLLQDLRDGWALKINHVMWSISVEWRIYFLFPLIVLLFRRLKLLYVLACGVLMSGVYAAILKYLPHRHYFSQVSACPHYIVFFALGAVASVMAASAGARDRKIMAGICAVSLPVLVALSFKGNGLAVSMLRDMSVGALFMTLIFFCFVSPQSLLCRAFSWRPLAFVGTFAYSLYLIHAPLLQCEWLILRRLHVADSVGLAIMCTLGALIIIGAAYLFFLGFEKPFLTTRSWRAWLTRAKSGAHA